MSVAKRAREAAANLSPSRRARILLESKRAQEQQQPQPQEIQQEQVFDDPGYLDLIKEGFQESSSGKLYQMASGDLVGTEELNRRQERDLPWYKSTVKGVSSLLGDAPIMAAAGLSTSKLGGGNPYATAIASGAGAFSAVDTINEMYDQYLKAKESNPDIKWDDYINSQTAAAGIKGAVKGAVLEAIPMGLFSYLGKASKKTGKVAEVSKKAISAVNKNPEASRLAIDMATLPTISAVADGRVPTADDYLENARVLGAYKLATKGVSKIAEVRKKLKGQYEKEQSRESGKETEIQQAEESFREENQNPETSAQEKVTDITHGSDLEQAYPFINEEAYQEFLKQTKEKGLNDIQDNVIEPMQQEVQKTKETIAQEIEAKTQETNQRLTEEITEINSLEEARKERLESSYQESISKAEQLYEKRWDPLANKMLELEKQIKEASAPIGKPELKLSEGDPQNKKEREVLKRKHEREKVKHKKDLEKYELKLQKQQKVLENLNSRKQELNSKIAKLDNDYETRVESLKQSREENLSKIEARRESKEETKRLNAVNDLEKFTQKLQDQESKTESKIRTDYGLDLLLEGDKLQDSLNALEKKRENISEISAEKLKAAKDEIRSKVSVNEDIKQKSLLNPLEKFYEWAVDDRYAVKALQKKLSKEELPYNLDVEKKLRKLSGADSIMESFIYDGVKDPSGKKYSSEGLAPILQELHKADIKMEDIADYIAARRNLELSERGIDSGISPESSAILVRAQAEKLEPYAKRITDYTDGLMKYWRDYAKILTPEEYDQIKAKNKLYTPFFAVKEEGARGGNASGSGAKLHKIEGSEYRKINPLESIINLTKRVARVAEQNDATKSLYNLLLTLKEQKKFDIDLETAKSKSPLVKDAFEFTGNEAKDSTYDKSLFIPNDGTLRFRNSNGETIEFRAPKEIVDTFKAATPQQLNFASKVGEFFAKTKRTGIVLSPGFQMANAIIDSVTKSVLTDTPLKYSLKGLKSALAKDQDYWSLKRSGGGMSRYDIGKRKNAQEFLNEASGVKSKNPLKFTYKLLENLGEKSEMANRVAVDKYYREKGLRPEDAAYLSRDMIDFARSGKFMRQWSKYVPFVNATIQGSDAFIRKLTNPKTALPTIYKGLALVTFPSVVTAINNAFYPEIYDLNKEERLKSFIVKVPGVDNYIKIPKFRELSALFGDPVELAIQYMVTQDPKAFKGFTKHFMNSFLPLDYQAFAPGGLEGPLENAFNTSFYTGKRLMNQELESRPVTLRYNENTTEVSKLTSKALDKIPVLKDLIPESQRSPIGIDNLINKTAGTMGSVIAGTASDAINAISGEGNERMSTGLSDFRPLDEVLRRFILPSDIPKGEITNEFWDNLDKYRKAKGEIKALEKLRIKENLTSKRREVARFNMDSYYNRVRTHLNNIQKIRSSKNLDGKQKRSKIMSEHRKIEKIAQEANSKARKYNLYND